MFAYPEFNENGVKTLCEMGKIQPEMNMTIRIKRFRENETLTLEEYQGVCDLFDNGVYDAIKLENCVRRRGM